MRRLFAAVCLALFPLAAAWAQAEPPWRHGLSLMGEPRYPEGFRRFDYVNPEAPKGGAVRFASEQGFDSFNFVIPRGSPAPGINYVYQQLLERSLDEVATEYGEIAEAVRHPDDYAWVEFRLRAEARWHDGRPITVEDVIWSFQVLTQNNPSMRFYYRNVVKAEDMGGRVVRFTFDAPGNREKPQIMGQMTILPKHWWTGADANGRPRDIAQTTLEPPLGSGAYRVARFEAGRTVVYERVRDWWAERLPVNVGKYNFDELRFDVFRDGTVALEAFKGDNVDWRTENSARQWSTQYDFPALAQGRVVRETFPERSSGRMQAFAFNTRREKFRDPRVRLAFNYAFDFEEANRALFFGHYQRVGSYFHGTQLASSGLPQGQELAILETVRDRVPAEVFTREFRNPVGGSAQAVRDNLREAARLLQEAGWTIRDRALVNARTGERMRVEFLLNSPAFERVVLPYKTALERLGMEVSVRLVDPSQYVNRLRARDFDVIVQSWGQSLSPGNEQRDFWGSEAADREGSRNVVGIKNSAVDALIDRIIFAKDRAELEAATRALDRVLLWNHYVVPQWSLGATWTARWDRFGRPERLPEYSFGFPDIWWWDAQRAARTGGRS
jgi:microcin C transport system substrate-binding protein